MLILFLTIVMSFMHMKVVYSYYIEFSFHFHVFEYFVHSVDDCNPTA